MDGIRFDSLTRTLADTRSRRHALGGLLAGALGLHGMGADETEAHNPLKKCVKKARKHNATHIVAIPPSCVPNCAGKTCGPDGCTGSCGLCTGGVCTADSCVCPFGMELCQGACVPSCVVVQTVLNPSTCRCCTRTGHCESNSDCCGGTCAGLQPSLPFGMCRALGEGATCSFDGQCLSKTCTNGTCVCPSGQVPCADNYTCAPPCSEGRFFAPNTCSCCLKNGEQCTGLVHSGCCAGGSQCIDFVCEGLPDGAYCTSALQCASGKCPSFTNRCGEPPVGP